MEPETLEILTSARALIEDPARWCQYMLATDANGRRCEATDKDAARWCANGAVDHVDAAFAKGHKIIIRPGSVTTDFGTTGLGMLAQAALRLYGDQTYKSQLANRWIDAPIKRLSHVNDFIGHAAALRVFDSVLATV